MVVLTSLGPPDEGVRAVQADTSVYINENIIPGGQGKANVGTIYISDARVSWVSQASDKGFSLEYPHIVLHAISRDPSFFPNEECLYLMIDVKLLESDAGTPTTSESEDEGDKSEDGMTEIRFVPRDKESLSRLFEALKACQALHPDPLDSSKSDEENGSDGEEGMFDDAEDDQSNRDGGSGDQGAEAEAMEES